MTAIFIVLAVNQIVATVVFAVCYAAGSAWRSSSIGRHLMFYTVAAASLDASWLLLVTVKQHWLAYVLFAAQLALGLLTWQRVWLVLRAQHKTRP